MCVTPSRIALTKASQESRALPTVSLVVALRSASLENGDTPPSDGQ
jgi:hypothetical protein